MKYITPKDWKHTLLLATNVPCSIFRLTLSDFQQIWRPNTFLIGSQHCTAAFFLQVTKLCTDLDPTLLYILNWNIYQICMEKSNTSARHLPLAALLEPWPQVRRIKITFTVLPTNRLVSITTNSMKYFVDWIPLRIRAGSRNSQPHVDKLINIGPPQSTFVCPTISTSRSGCIMSESRTCFIAWCRLCTYIYICIYVNVYIYTYMFMYTYIYICILVQFCN